MIFSETYISELVFDFFIKNQTNLLDYNNINSLIKEVSGINNFFISQEQSYSLLEKIENHYSIVSDDNRREYGDFQTNETLANKVVEYTFSKFSEYEFILEPTCGKGNLLLASIKQARSVKKVVGIEIHQPYVWETKFKLLEYFLSTKCLIKPEIDIINANIFDFKFEELAESTRYLNTLIIGNPPWVTNSELSSIDSKNIPHKSNFKNYSGLDAITGKGNFDIGEYISILMLKYFNKHNGTFAFLIKNAVVKNIIHDQRYNNFNISKSEKLNIDSKKEFNVSVNACLFVTHLNDKPDYVCNEYDLYTFENVTTFGWYKNKFVYSIQDYDKTSIVDGKSIFIWRSGIKHDCSKIMELEQINGYYKNAIGEETKLEEELIYGLLKSSDLKDNKINSYRKSTIITQKNIGAETLYIKDKFPLIYKYLSSHKESFQKRKSSIYVDKPDFSIFGVGDYSFAPYKVAISGLYKSTHFTLVSPLNVKPIMLDDTCYFIGFDNLVFAEIAHYLLNSDLVQMFLKSIIFSDSKRSINKDSLMRIDFEMVFSNTDFKLAKENIKNLKYDEWITFGNIVAPKIPKQKTLF